MSKFLAVTTAAALALTISACSGNDAPDSDNVTETRMDDIDVIDGTISDEMVDVDTIKEGDATADENDTESESENAESSAGENDADAATTADD